MSKGKIYIICPVRKASEEIKEKLRDYKQALVDEGYEVFLPFDDNPHEGKDLTGAFIVDTNLQAIREADEVHIAWDYTSEGSVFDLGATMALKKKIKLVPGVFIGEPTHKASITKVLISYLMKSLKEV